MKPSELTDEQLSDILDGLVSTETLEYEDSGPGKFEGNANPGLAEAIYDRAIAGWNDDVTGSIDWYFYVGRLGRFLLYENDRGFVTLEEFPNEDAARAVFEEHDRAYTLWDDDDGEA